MKIYLGSEKLKILHYALGLPPYRTGGLTKYVVDLMKEQNKLGHEIFFLWPGKIKIINKKSEIKFKSKQQGLRVYELVNPQPVPLLEGISNIELYTKSTDKTMYRDFFKKIKPDIIHVHTLMGIHKEFFEVANELEIPIIYTTHDYFGICPKVNLLYKAKKCENVLNCSNCNECNRRALSYRKIVLMQSPFYKLIKNSRIVKYFRKKYKAKQERYINTQENKHENIQKDEKYIKLREYYSSIFQKIDKFHFNSTNTKEIFQKYLDIKNGKVISLTHSDIINRKEKKNYEDFRKITYLGPTKEYKGFYLLLRALDYIYSKQCKNFILNIYDKTIESREYISSHEKYSYEQIERNYEGNRYSCGS